MSARRWIPRRRCRSIPTRFSRLYRSSASKRSATCMMRRCGSLMTRKTGRNIRTRSSRAMPIYEWQCGEGHVFEMLTPAGASKRGQPCPNCGARSERVISTFAIHGGPPVATASERAAARDVDVTKLKLPNFARLCGMDDYSATRLAAQKVGRGAEFDDKMAARKERHSAVREAPITTASGRGPKHSH